MNKITSDDARCVASDASISLQCERKYSSLNERAHVECVMAILRISTSRVILPRGCDLMPTVTVYEGLNASRTSQFHQLRLTMMPEAQKLSP